MADGLKLPKYSVGVGDRFAHQAKAQLAACIKAEAQGVIVVPVWNKSNREHTIIGTEPSQTRAAADAAVKELGWKHPYFLDADLAGNLSAAAHLIHGSSEGRFNIRYCPGHLTQQEIESVHFEYGDLKQYMAKYDPDKLKDGWNIVDGEEIFYISNPGLGLWAYKGRFH